MRKHYFTWILVLICAVGASAQSIRQARAAGAGQTVTVTGIVLNGPELGPIRYLQDTSGAIAAYFASGQPQIYKGDSITVQGTLKNYNSLLEIDPVLSHTVLATRRTVPEPTTVTAANAASVFAEAYEGQLVKITGLTSITLSSGGNPATIFAGNTNYNLNGLASLQMRINSGSTGDTGLVGKPAPSGTFDVVGIMSQFCNAACVSGGGGGYQLLTRLLTDVQAGPAPNIISRLKVEEINQTSLRLSFLTQNAGDTRLVYGTSPSVLGQQVADVAMVTDHGLTINNLQPGTVYYVQAVSRNPNGTSTSPAIYAFVTESQSTGKIKTYFTKSVDTRVAMPNNAVSYAADAIADTIAAYIARADSTLDVAIYNFGTTGGHDVIETELNAAATRGVRVRLICEGDNANNSIPSLNSAIKVLKSPVASNQSMGIMHNKFVIVDADSRNPNDVWLWTGSTNWTDAQLNVDPNNGILFQDQSIARSYKVEFEEMWGSNTGTPGAIYTGAGSPGTARFGALKTDNTPHEMKIGGKRVEMYFSPTDQVNSTIINTVHSANTSIHIAANVLTRADIAFAIRDRVDSLGAGNCARGLMDDTSSAEEKTAFRAMRQTMGTNIRIYNRTGIFHHKYMIVDADGGADPLVLTGSHNWSTAADTKNDENTVIVHDEMIANQFYQEFAARYGEINGGTVCALTATKPAISNNLHVYPNPASNVIRIGGTVKAARLTDALGRSFTPTLSRNGGETEVNVKGLANGIYLLMAEDAQGLKTVKVSIER